MTGVVLKHALSERGNDLYETPKVAVEALLRVERLPPQLWDPCSGPGNIVDVLRAHGHQVIGSDLVDYGRPDFFSHHLRRIADLLGGDLAGDHTILCPGPGHSRRDRSLAVRFDPRAPDGFMAYSHSGDDWRVCRDHVARLLGLPEWRRRQDFEEVRRTKPSAHSARRPKPRPRPRIHGLPASSGMAALTLAGPPPSFT